MLHIRTIVHPTDFSEAANEALQVARALARDHQAKLVLVAVPQLPPPPYKYPFPPGQTEYAADVQATRRRLDALAKSIVDIPVETAISTGPPGPAILTVASNHRADLIVMGTHGRTGVPRLLLGSVAEHVLRHAACPVLTIRPGTGGHLGHDVETGLGATRSTDLANPVRSL